MSAPGQSWEKAAALERLVCERGVALRRYCYGILLHPQDAEDAVQTALLKAYRKWETLRDPDALAAYAYRAAYTACMDLMRQRRRRPAEAPLPVHEGMRLSEEVEAALQALSAQDRALVIGRAVEEKPYEQLARIHCRPAATLRKRYERARKRLAILLSEEEDESPPLERRTSYER